MIIIPGDCREVLPTLAARSAQTVVTSVPYLQQRNYGTDHREIGREATLELYVTSIADVFDELRRILVDDGLAWLNIGDKANGSGGAGGDWSGDRTRSGGPGKFHDPAYEKASFLDVPGAVVGELINRGWRLRSAIVWDKGREAPESLRHVRRPRLQHEMIYMLAPTAKRSRFFPSMLTETGSIWHFTPGGNGDPHLAPFPDELARRCILPSTLPGDVVLDPFSGAGTTARVAEQHGRTGIGIELYASTSETEIA